MKPPQQQLEASVNKGDPKSGDIDDDSPKEGFSPFVALCFTIDYAIGTGFLTIPWAMTQGGLFLSTLTLLIVGFFSNMTKNYSLEAMARAEAVNDTNKNDVVDDSTSLVQVGGSHRRVQSLETSFPPKHHLRKSSLEFFAGTPTTSIRSLQRAILIENYELADIASLTSSPDISRGEKRRLAVKDIKFEINELCHKFLGKTGQKIFLLCIISAFVGNLWCLASVFSSAMAKMVPVYDSFVRDYEVYNVLFGVVVVPLSCLELTEQASFQIALSLCRFLVIFLMVGTVMAGMSNTPEEVVYFKSIDSAQGADLFNFSGFHHTISILVYAFMIHNGLPILSEPVENKKKLGSIFRYAFILCGALFLSLGMSLAWYFGDQIEQAANLNWNDYIGGTGEAGIGPGDFTNVALWAQVLAIFVLCFPALAAVSSYPLNAIVLGNSLMGGVYGESIHEVEKNRLQRILFRGMFASLPPIFGAFFVRDLGIITSYTGVFSLATVFPFPALLYITSKRAAEENGITNDTYYRGIGSNEMCAKAVFIFSLALIMYIFITLLY